MKKAEEKYLFQIFSEKYKDMPNGTAEFSDKPDVIFTTSATKIIGIELTECIYDKDLMQKSEFKIKFNKKVITQLQVKMPFKFHLDIDLDANKPIKQNQIKSTIDEITEICVREFKDLNPFQSKNITGLDVDWHQAPRDIQKYFLDRGYRKLPTGISRIQMSRYDILSNSTHPEYKGGVVPDFTDNDLNSILSKKNKALLNYRVCDQYWLLIVEGVDFYSYINNIRIEKGFETKFDKIFMYRTSESQVVVIK